MALLPHLHPSIMRPRRPKQYCLQLHTYIYIHPFSKTLQFEICTPFVFSSKGVLFDEEKNTGLHVFVKNWEQKTSVTSPYADLSLGLNDDYALGWFEPKSIRGTLSHT